MISIKSEYEISIMREASKILVKVFEEVEKLITPGTSTEEIDLKAESLILDCNATPAFKGYQGFPKSICTSINHEVIHGIPKKEVFMDDLPSETWHGYKYIDFGPDGNLYIPVGVPCNICLEPQTKDKRFAAIHKYVDGKLVTVASGVRNSVGFDWHPKTNKLYFSDNGRDWLGDNSPSCELNVIEEDGSFYGYPYKHAKDVIDPEFGKLIPNVDMEFVDPNNVKLVGEANA